MEDEKKITEDIINQRRLPYSIQIVKVEGDKITTRNNFGSTIVYIKKGENYFLEEKLK